MTYEEWITSSKTWTCPKAGIWEIICVGGGASGGESSTASGDISQNTGGTTSFGNFLSAAGAQKSTRAWSTTNSGAGGTGGYTGLLYGGAGACANDRPAVGNGGNPGESGLGFGAGGGSTAGYSTGGLCGEMKSITMDLTLNQSISCTIGSGGASVSSKSQAGKSGCIHVRFIQ